VCTFRTCEERLGTGRAVEFNTGGGVDGTAVGADEGTGAKKVVGEILVVTYVARDGLGFVGKLECAPVGARDREGSSVGQRKGE
jgi:hypothetical protein